MSEKGPCPHCGRWLNRPVVVDGVVLNAGNQVLLIKRGRDPEMGKYALPGGFVDWDETASAAVIRELREETGLSCAVRGFVGYYDALSRDPSRRTVSLAFYCVAEEGRKALAGDDAAECRWFSLDSLPELAFDHSAIIRDFRRVFQI